jgi:hypothetical protein
MDQGKLATSPEAEAQTVGRQEEQPQTLAVDFTSPQYQSWYRAGSGSTARNGSDATTMRDSAHAAPSMLPREPRPGQPYPNWPRPGPTPHPKPSPGRPPIANFHAYRNWRGDADWNTCGQAAIASMLDFHGRDPFGLPRTRAGADGRMHWEDGAIIDALKEDGWGADVVFGWGTTPGRIEAALRHYGLNQVYSESSGLFSIGWEELWERLKYFLRTLQMPVPVLLDLSALGGDWGLHHWPIAYRITAAEEIHLANCSWRLVVDRQTFLKAWQCPFLPLGFNYSAVYYSSQWG